MNFIPHFGFNSMPSQCINDCSGNLTSAQTKLLLNLRHQNLAKAKKTDMKKLYFTVSALFLTLVGSAQLSIPTTDVPVFIDFTGFAGAGFQPGGGAGALNSDEWCVKGLSEGDFDFGATAITGDYARGTTMGLVTTGGIYGVDIAGNQGLMIQPTADDFTPGSFILKIENNTGVEVTELAIAYTVYLLNDASRSNSFNFSISYDNITYTAIPALDYTSPEAIDFTPYVNYLSTNISGLSIPDGSLLYLSWTGNDVGGAGSRDEFAVDDISITAIEGEPLVLVTFDPAAVIVDEAVGLTTGNISLTGSTDCEVNVSINPTSTADLTDVIFTEFGVLFSPGDPTDYLFNIGIVDDAVVEADETFILDLSYVDGTCAIGLPSSLTVLITDNDVPPPPIYTPYDVAEVTAEDVDGNAVSIGEMVDLTGVVHGINTWDGGLQFTLIDATGGINVFSFDNDFGYTVLEGDKINVLGVINQFNGLTEVEPDTLIFIDGANALVTAAPITALTETTESDLVYIDTQLNYVDIGQWLGDGSAFNVDLTDGTNTYTIRIDDNCELSTLPAPAAVDAYWLSVKGIGSQYDTDAPYADGYQLFPRYASDIEVNIILAINETINNNISVYPNPASDYFTVTSSENIFNIEIVNNIGQAVLTNSNFVSGNTIPLENVASGIYNLIITTEKGIYNSSIIIE